MLSLYNKLKIFARENGSLLTLYVAVAPFVLSLVFLIVLARGDTQIVSYLVLRLGLADVWVVGVLGLAIAMMQVATILALLYTVENHRKLEEWKLWSISVLATIALTIVPIIAIIGGVLGVLVRLLVLRHDKSKKTAYLNRTQQTAKVLLVYFTVTAIALSITSYPQLPQTLYTIGDKVVSGKEITHDDATTLILEKDSSQLQLLSSHKITKKEICITTSKSWSSKTIIDFAVNKKRVRSCE